MCNALTEDNLNCLFLGPELSYFWEDIPKQEEEQQEAKRLGKGMKGNIGRRLLSNRIMSIHEIFEKGYKSAYWVFNGGGIHWYGVYCFPGTREDGILKQVKYYVVDSFRKENPDPDAMKKFFEKKFQVDEVIKIEPPVPSRGQKDGSSCGVPQCLFMADLALGVPNWFLVVKRL